MSRAFVLGNGQSRSRLEINRLVGKGKIYACNAVYRTFSPDYIVAVDTKMVNEICHNGYQKIGEVWTNYNKAYERFKGLNYFEPSKGWSSGPTALDMASNHGHDSIYILGFDYKGIGPEGKRVNNIYSGTPNYKREHDNATYFGNWLRQTCTILGKNSKKRYIRVLVNDKGFIPEPFEKYGNLTHITREDFAKSFNIQLS